MRRPPPPTRRVPKSQIRKRFNDDRYWERAQAGEFWQRVLSNRHPSAPRAREPFCTRSQIIAYFGTAGEKVAIVHQYLRPDGTIGAGGRPDPKQLLVADEH